MFQDGIIEVGGAFSYADGFIDGLPVRFSTFILEVMEGDRFRVRWFSDAYPVFCGIDIQKAADSASDYVEHSMHLLSVADVDVLYTLDGETALWWYDIFFLMEAVPVL